MTDKIIGTLITCIVSGSFGYCISLIKTLNKRNKASDEALGGDDYIHILAGKMKTWNIDKTDIIN